MALKIILSVMVLIHIFFILGVLRKKFDIIDIGWALGFILIALMSYLHHPLSFKNVLILLAVSIWGMRLALYIFGRGRGKPEDHRYAKFRESWKPHENLQAYLKVFLFQGLLMLIVTLPVSMGISLEVKTLSVINWIGFVIWIIGLTFESWADYYLLWFKKKPENAGKICMSGPWKLCRFPNYFGEVLLWYGMYLLCFEVSIFWTIIGPITLNYLILKVTGVPLLEEHYKNRISYEEYSKRVPRFIPLTKP